MVPTAAPTLVSLLLLLSAVPMAPHSVPLQADFLEEAGGSGEAEGSSASSPSLMPAFNPTSGGPRPTVLAGPPTPDNLMDGIVDFFRQYVMLIAVVGSLMFLLMFIVCAALITRQKHKASAYYPSSFPKKKYVDQSDRAGGSRAFSEVPDRASVGRPEDVLDSSQQLQADILAATQNLKSLTKAAPGSRDGAKAVEFKSAEEEEGSSPGADKEAQGLPAESPTKAPEEPCSVGPEEGLGAVEGQGDPEAVPSLVQEVGDPAGPPESLCACSSVTPIV
ncbi:PREDICTED: transmembrane protein 119 [Chrysochloris asiatica]|uniref:Transmembrane protein 119 n=1 Tax=Chrysochloris asiatica TaxID=185453 RepID=A0A9B0TUK3_CHRAS|nr:PREDICTED: transmembrane protein 119 [Chrysochloris asiatica]